MVVTQFTIHDLQFTNKSDLRYKGNRELTYGIETCVKFGNIKHKFGYEKIILS